VYYFPKKARRGEDMSFINVSEGDGELAINLDQIKYVRFINGTLNLYFEGGSDEPLILQGGAAAEVWKRILNINIG
jgi:hypothetical protein